MSRGVLLAALVFGGCSDEGSDDGASGDSTLRPDAVVTVGEIPDVVLGPDGSASVEVPISVADGYHVQANPASGEFLVPLEVVLLPVDGLLFGTPRYPGGVPYLLEGTKEPLMTYEGTFVVGVPVTTSSPGAYDVSGEVNFQACTFKQCLFPSSVPLAFKVRVAEETPRNVGSAPDQ